MMTSKLLMYLIPDISTVICVLAMTYTQIANTHFISEFVANGKMICGQPLSFSIAVNCFL